MQTAPVLFLIFNRPDLTERTFERIREMKPEYLYVAADGPRRNRLGEDADCSQARAITDLVDWDCEVHRLYRDENLGCKLAVSAAITWFFEHVESGIILEDDCLPEPSFFQFCSELLERYKNHENMGIIAGTNPLPIKTKVSGSYYFSKYPHIWGWATWRKVWKEYDVDLKSWSGDENDLIPCVHNRLVRKYFASLFDEVKEGRAKTWDYQLAHLCITRKKFSITPSVSLITNIGFDERATHTLYVDAMRPPPVGGEMTFPLEHPENIVPNSKLDRVDEVKSFGIPSSELRLTAGKVKRFASCRVSKLFGVLGLKPS